MNNTLSNHTCPVCGSSHFEVFFEMLEVPVFCNVLWSEKSGAQTCKKGDIKLSFCSDCGFIGNVAFDPSRLEYTQVYENSLDFSPRFQDYAKSLAKRLIENHNLHDKDIIEIGCGKGDFLFLLCELGNNQGVGFDPSYVPLESHQKIQDRMQIIQDYYSDKYANYASDFICCRHTLEHIPQPISLLKNLRKTIGERQNTAVFFEVPNALDTFRDMAIWDIIYEHCCYFAPVCLSQAFSISGFKVSKVTEEYRGQFLCLESQPGEVSTTLTQEQSQQLQQLAHEITAFTTKFKNKVETWTDKLEYLANQGQRAVVWGAGSKGVTFLNLLKHQQQIEYVVDLNPRKHGMYVAGTGQEIVAPEFLREYQPNVVLIMNPIYEKEIQQMTEDMGLNPEFMCV
ncbi:MAG: methyltransferase domain-containing protein [Nostocaceae cyanobacterium]|nr:methyltransferase domain-containing protein [Nostocaceae cyanobacterium]